MIAADQPEIEQAAVALRQAAKLIADLQTMLNLTRFDFEII